MEQARQEIQRILKTVGIETASEMANIQEPIFGTLDNLEAFVCEELFHRDQRRRCKYYNAAAALISSQCRKYLEQPRADIKAEPQDDYPDFPPGEILRSVKEEPVE